VLVGEREAEMVFPRGRDEHDVDMTALTKLYRICR
jgi:hypothetical protein